MSGEMHPYFYERCAAAAAQSAADFDHIMQHWTYSDTLLYYLMRK